MGSGSEAEEPEPLRFAGLNRLAVENQISDGRCLALTARDGEPGILTLRNRHAVEHLDPREATRLVRMQCEIMLKLALSDVGIEIDESEELLASLR